MNKTSIINRLNNLKSQYPQHTCNFHGTVRESQNALDHSNKIYKITCAIMDSWRWYLISKKTARSYGKILRQHEYYPGEAGLEHFHLFDGL